MKIFPGTISQLCQALLLFPFLAFADTTPKPPKAFFTNDPPVLTATGNQIYCPGSPMKVVTNMTITDPDDTATDAVYIQISSGYISAQDILSLTGNHPGLTSSWDPVAGKLTLKSPANLPVSYADFVAAIEDVVYSNSSTSPSGTRTFSISVGQANYLPSTGHYYQFVPALGITWTNAKTLAEQSTYYGLQGYLATITAADEAQLSGEQASGAGWIGGSDAASEGVWKWVTGPENGTIFWNGSASGSTPNFALWNSGEPNNLGNENYAHVTAPGVGITGSWNDLSNTGDVSGNYQPKGYIVEYGGMPGDPVLNISTSTTITIPAITGISTGSICGPGSVTLSVLSSGGTVKWYDSPVSSVPLATGNTFNTPVITTTTTYYADAFELGCSNANRTPVTATVTDIPVVTAVNPSPGCEGPVTFQASATSGTIRWYESATASAVLGTGTTYSIANLTQTTTLYAEAENNNCFSTRVPVTAIVNPKPIVNDETLPICENGTRQLDAGISNVSYLWSPSGETAKVITISGPGTYSVVLTTPQNCSVTKTFTVNEKLAPVISSVLVNETSVTINTANTGDFEYSVDGTNYQASNFFIVENAGIHTAYVRETGFCGDDHEDFAVLVVPTFFTPNNDTFNDFWTVRGMSLFPQARVTIFDRFGRFVTELNKHNLTWDGTFNRRVLPADDYWFVFRKDALSPEVRGHFSLIR